MALTCCVPCLMRPDELQAEFGKQLGGFSFLHSQRAVFIAAPSAPPTPPTPPGEGSVSVTQGQAEGRLELGMLSPWQSSVRPPPACLSLVVMRREHPLPTRPIPTAETEPLGVGGGLQLLKWSVSVSAGLWSWTRLGLERLGPRRRCPPGQSIRHSPLASLLIIQGISGILDLDHLIVLFWNWCISCSLAELSFVCIYLKENQCLKRPMYLIL